MLKKLFFIASFFICVDCFTQQYPFVHYTPRDGLVNNRVRKAYQDSKGRMYFLTIGGLSMYDGVRFRNYTMQNGLLSDFVNDILEVGEDTLLVATNTCGLNILVHGQMKISKITGANCPVVNHLLKDNDGAIYATADDGLYVLKQQTKFEKLSTLSSPKNEPTIYLGAVVDYKDFLVFTTNELRNYTGLFLYNKKDNRITDVLPQLYVSSLNKDRNGIIWLSTSDKVLNLDTSALATGKLVLMKPYASYIKQGKITPGSIVFNLQNELLVSYGSNEIIRYRKNGTKLHITAPELFSFVTQNFFIDREDILWICHDGNGIYKLSNTNLQSPASFFGENRSGVKILKTNTPDSCWIMMNNGQLMLHTSSNNKNFSVTPSINARALHYNNKYLYAADNHKLYMAAMPDKDATIIRFKQILALPDTASFGNRFVNDPYGNLILFEERNICVLQNEKLLFTYPINRFDLIEGMYIDKNNQLWVVSRGGGLQILSLHPENPSLYLQIKYQFIKEFENASSRCITVDKNGILWVGTRNNGLLGFEYKNNQLIKRYHYKTQNGLTDNFITDLTCDENNNIIIGTQTGLDRLLKTKNNFYRVENVTKSNNIFSYIRYVWTDANMNAFALTNSGTVFQVEPVQNDTYRYEPQLLIEEIRINGKSMPDFHSPLQLQHQQSNITFSVAAPAFLDEKQVKYSYVLLGSGNKEWSDTSSIADITLLNLSPGKYTLQVKAFFLSTSYAPKETAFSFVILPPWWQTWWFRIGVGLVAIGVLIAGIRFYYRSKLEKQKALLDRQQAIEKERTRIASDMHDDLGAGLSTLRFLSEKVKRNSFSDVTRNDAGKIVDNSNDLVQKMNEIIWAMNEKNDTVEDLIFYTRAYAVEYCEENDLECEVNIPETIPPHFVSGEVRRNLFLTVKESLHNIVKHADAKKVKINFFVGKFFFVSINDNGKGFTVNNNGEGNGLKNMKKRIGSIGGNFEILNEKGTIVNMTVPLI